MRWSALLALALALGGCGYASYFLRDVHQPMLGLEARMDPARRRACLIVLMPGMFDTPDQFLEYGFIDDARAASGRCDLVAIDAHFGYYRDGSLRRRVGADILRVAAARGYEHIWLVGISLGGLGAMLVARDHPDEVDGVVLLAPFLGDPRLIESIHQSGGLAAWDAPEDAGVGDANTFDDAIWGWLQGYVTHPARMPRLYVGAGTEDDLRSGVQLLAAVLPQEQHGEAEGGHGWVTWRVLWRRLMASPPWDRAAEVPRIDR